LDLSALALARDLLRCPSVTPRDAGAQAVLADALERLGFTVTLLPFGPEPIHNLYARLGTGGPHLCFAGHTDVVPEGMTASWSSDPFAGDVRDGLLYGRGACDMKGGIAAFVAAVARLLAQRPLRGSVSLLITGDEEGPARHGTREVLEWMRAHGEAPDFCLLGEPTNPRELGEVIKIGRRGSLNARIAVEGRQGHVAYPDRADNPVHRLMDVLSELRARTLDAGTEWFEPSSLQVTSIDVGNAAHNVIPQEAGARLNIRFNDAHRGEELASWIRDVCARHGKGCRAEIAISGEAFVTEPGSAVTRLVESVAAITGRTPRLDTGGGTSDARFISTMFPVAEFGLVGASMHQVDEHVSLANLAALDDIYLDFMQRFGL
jgi:succinyl-diaminopimelate desuccinylase